MVPKRPYRTLSDASMLSILRSFHRDGVRQRDLILQWGVDSAYVSRLVHGDKRPDLYAIVEQELKARV